MTSVSPKILSYGIVGASGHTAQELLTILRQDSRLQCVFLHSRSSGGTEYETLSKEEMKERNPDYIFFATPHGVCMEYASFFLDTGIQVIDLSGDFRFQDSSVFETVYSRKHSCPSLSAVYGLSEVFTQEIKNSAFISNPGCYVTASLLALFPLKEEITRVCIDAKSGYSGAGKKFSLQKEIEENTVMPYTLIEHRHESEMQQFFSFPLHFTPHLINRYRGLLATIHIQLKNPHLSETVIFEKYQSYYKESRFVQIQKDIPCISECENTNTCRIGGFQKDSKGNLVLVSVLDNLRKGASGQAVQNMYISSGMEYPDFLV